MGQLSLSVGWENVLNGDLKHQEKFVAEGILKFFIFL